LKRVSLIVNVRAAVLNTDTTVVIGAGQAAARCALELRRLGYEGQVVLLGNESTPPYQRPELSKSYLARSVSPDEVVMLTPVMAAEYGIELKLGAAVEQVDLSQRLVSVAGEQIAFDKLVFATGGRARTRDGALRLRTLSDADQLYNTLRREQRLTVIGGGWLGLEVAATARSHGLDVRLFEQNERLCARSVPEEISALLLAHQQCIGVEVNLGSSPGEDALDSDIACACIGISPNTQLAESAGVEVDRGIIVNDRQMTSAPNVFAIGDCARPAGQPALENWAYANVSAERAAHAICDIALPVAADLWLWSKQGDLLIQKRGDFAAAEECIVRTKGASTCYFYLRDKRLACCIAINDTVQFGQSRALFRSQRQLDLTALADTRVPLKSVGISPAKTGGQESAR
jgi:3-phenylpropionate/trans-cinnamate dioxygenase ferredoxin reductase subunit